MVAHAGMDFYAIVNNIICAMRMIKVWLLSHLQGWLLKLNRSNLNKQNDVVCVD